MISSTMVTSTPGSIIAVEMPAATTVPVPGGDGADALPTTNVDEVSNFALIFGVIGVVKR